MLNKKNNSSSVRATSVSQSPPRRDMSNTNPRHSTVPPYRDGGGMYEDRSPSPTITRGHNLNNASGTGSNLYISSPLRDVDALNTQRAQQLEREKSRIHQENQRAVNLTNNNNRISTSAGATSQQGGGYTRASNNSSFTHQQQRSYDGGVAVGNGGHRVAGDTEVSLYGHQVANSEHQHIASRENNTDATTRSHINVSSHHFQRGGGGDAFEGNGGGAMTSPNTARQLLLSMSPTARHRMEESQQAHQYRNSLSDDVNRCIASITEKDEKIVILNQRCTELEGQVEEAKETIQDLAHDRSELVSEGSELRLIISRLEGKCAAQLKKLESNEDDLKRYTASLQAKVEALGAQLSVMTGERTSSERALSDKELEVATLRREIQSLHGKQQRAVEQARQEMLLELNSNNLDKSSAAKAKIDAIQVELREQTSALTEMKAAMTRLRDEKKMMAADLEQMNAIVGNKDGMIQSLQHQLAEARRQAKMDKSALETENLHLVTGAKDVAEQARQLQLSTLRQELEKKTQQVETLEHKLQAAWEKCEITSAQRASDRQLQLATFEEKHRALNETVRQLEGRELNLQDSIQRLKTKLADADSLNKELRIKLTGSTDTIDFMDREIVSKDEELKRTVHRVKALQEEVIELKRSRDALIGEAEQRHWEERTAEGSELRQHISAGGWNNTTNGHASSSRRQSGSGGGVAVGSANGVDDTLLQLLKGIQQASQNNTNHVASAAHAPSATGVDTAHRQSLNSRNISTASTIHRPADEDNQSDKHRSSSKGRRRRDNKRSKRRSERSSSSSSLSSSSSVSSGRSDRRGSRSHRRSHHRSSSSRRGGKGSPLDESSRNRRDSHFEEVSTNRSRSLLMSAQLERERMETQLQLERSQRQIARLRESNEALTQDISYTNYLRAPPAATTPTTTYPSYDPRQQQAPPSASAHATPIISSGRSRRGVSSPSASARARGAGSSDNNNTSSTFMDPTFSTRQRSVTSFLQQQPMDTSSYRNDNNMSSSKHHQDHHNAVHDSRLPLHGS